MQCTRRCSLASALLPEQGYQRRGFSGTFTFINRLRDMISERQAHLRVRLNELYTPHAAQTTGGASRVREVFPEKASYANPTNPV